MNQARWNRYMLPAALAWTALMVVGSSIPSLPRHMAPLFHYDKVMHFMEYAVFSWLWGGALRAVFPRLLPGRLWLIIIAAGLAWAALDEQYQGIVGRSKDFFDWVADAVGICAAQAVQEYRARRKRGGEKRGAL